MELFTDLDMFNLVNIGYGVLVLIIPQLPQKMMLASKAVKIDLKITILLRWSKSVTHSVWEIYHDPFKILDTLYMIIYQGSVKIFDTLSMIIYQGWFKIFDTHCTDSETIC